MLNRGITFILLGFIGCSLFHHRANAQTVPAEQITALQGLSPFGQLNSTNAGQSALQTNLTTTGSIQNGTSSVPFLMPFPQQQQQALRDAQITSSNAYGLTDGLGTKLQNSYQSLTTYTSPNNGTTVSSTGISTNINNLIAYTNQLTGNDATAGKYFFANGTINGSTPTTNPQLQAILNLPGFQTDTYGTAYNLPAGPTPNSDPYGDARPFQTLVANNRPLTLFNGNNFFGNPSGNFDYLYGPTQNLTASPAFPSGHTTYGNTESVLLAILVPQRFQQMVTRGVEYGANRIIMGAHYATDVIAGRTLAYYDVAQMMANNSNYLGTQSISSYNQVNGGASSVTITNYQTLVSAAQSDMASALQSACGGSLVICATQDTSRFSSLTSNKALYESTLTFGLPTVYSGNILPVNFRTYSNETYNAGYLLMSRFPYLTNDQRADVITSTQSAGQGSAAGNFLDNGSSFGYYSRINLFAAGGGYGAFNDMTGPVSITMNAALGGFNAADTWSNDIGGNEGFTLNGTGIMTFTGANTYAGPTIVNGGALIVDGSLTSNVTVNSGGLLGGHGSFGGGVINAGGFISPGNSPGTITSNGNLTLQQGSIYLAEIFGTNADKIIVNGTATVNNASLFLNTSLPAYLAGRQFNILTATGGVTGSFSGLTSAQSFSFLNPYLSSNGNSITIGYSLTPFSTVAKNINQRNVGNALTIAALGPVNSLGAPILNALFYGNYENAQAVMDTVSGSGLAGVQSTAMQVGETASSAVSDQIAFWRSGETMDATGRTSQEGNNPRNFLAYAATNTKAPAKGLVNVKGPAGNLAASVAPRTFRAWGSMFGGGANYLSDAGRGAAASNVGFYGGLLGVDYQIQPNLLVGVALGGSNANFNVGSLSTNGNLTGFHAGVYGAYTMGNSYVALNETFSAYNNQTSRKAGGYALMPYEQLSAQFGSTEFRTRAEVGHGVLMGGLKATPFVAAEIAAFQSNAFSEQSSIYASTFALKNNGQGINSLPTFAGLRLSNTVTLSNGWRLAPVGSVAYVHEFFPQRQFNNMLISMPSSDFNVSGPRSTYNLVQTKMGVQLNLNQKLAMFTDFQGEFSPVSQSYAGKIGVKYVW